MLVIGVTGQTGAGKGTVCKMLEKYGLYHIDADKVAHSVYKKMCIRDRPSFSAFSTNYSVASRSVFAVRRKSM